MQQEPHRKLVSVRSTPWIPVLGPDGPVLMGLEEALLRAHEISHLATRNDLERSSMLRFLTAMTVLVAREQKLTLRSSKALIAAGSGLNPSAVKAVLDALDDRLYLIHPEHPFMQDPAAAVAPAKAASTLHPGIASESSQNWFGIKTLSSKDLTPAEAIQALVAFYFHAPSVTSGGPAIEVGTGPDGKPQLYMFALRGGGVGNRLGDDMHIWWRGTTLLTTLLLNIHPHWVLDDDDTLPAWFGKPSLLRQPGSLNEWTHSGVSALLEPNENGGNLVFSNVRMCGAIMLTEAQDSTSFRDAVKAQMDRAHSSDPRRVFVEVPQKGNAAPKRQQVSGMTPANAPIQNLAAWWQNEGKPSVAGGLLPLTGLKGIQLDVLALTVTQNAGSQMVKDTGWLTIDRRATGVDVTDTMLLRVLAQEASLNIERVVKTAFRIMDPATGGKGKTQLGPTGSKLCKTAMTSYYTGSTNLLDRVLAGVFVGEPVPDDLAMQVSRIALDSFDQVTAPHLSLRLTPRIAMARVELLKQISRNRPTFQTTAEELDD